MQLPPPEPISQRTAAAGSASPPLPGAERQAVAPPQRSRIRVGFLFNHEALHQIAHSAPIISALLVHNPDLDITVLTSSDEQARLVRDLVDPEVASSLAFVPLRLPKVIAKIERFARHIAPFKRVAVLRYNIDRLSRFHALVVPETTSTLLKSRFGMRDTRLIYTHHGAGDGPVGFESVIRKFDFVLISGSKVRNRLLELGFIDSSNHAIVGYPKFDAANLSRNGSVSRNGTASRNGIARLFDNENPTVLYNPHFDPRLSSWYGMGNEILEFFADSRDYNLVFAPHVMLFQRRFHTSLGMRRVRFRSSLDEKYLRCRNIHVDLGSTRCVDMSYTLGCDIYLGEASSQVYEFLVEPRPCIFLNALGLSWKGDPSFLHWTLGPVVEDLSGLERELRRASADPSAYRDVQQRVFADTFDQANAAPAYRAADEIARFLERSCQRLGS